jgi:RND family efflux transporter MFP subunit
MKGDGNVNAGRKHILGICASIALVSALVATSGCKKKDVEQGSAERGVQRVEVAAIKLGDIAETVTLTGEVVPLSTVVLTSKVAGRLEKLRLEDSTPIAEGSRVEAGKSLVEIDKAVYAAQLDQAEAAVAAATAGNKDATREEERMAVLFKEGAATEQMRDRTATGRDAAAAALKQAEAARKMARINFDEAIIESPISGIVTAKHIDEGNMVAPGMPILTIQDMSKARIIFSVPERYLPRLVAGKTPVAVTPEAYTAEPIQTVVAKIYPAADRATRTTLVELLLDNAGQALRSGMFVKVVIEVDRATAVPVMPAAAILRQENDIVVFVADGPKAIRRVVQLGLLENNMYAVKDGLKEGDLVIIRGQHLLSDGDRIEIAGEEAR